MKQQKITKQTFADYKPGGFGQGKIFDPDEGAIITFDTDGVYLRAHESSSDGSTDTLIHIGDGSAGMLRDDGVLLTTPPSKEILHRVDVMTTAKSNEDAVSAWRMVQMLMVRLRLMQKLDGGNLSIVVMQ